MNQSVDTLRTWCLKHNRKHNHLGECERCVDNAFRKQYLNGRYGGFCARCGEAVPPFTPDLPEDVQKTACKCEEPV